MNKPIFVGLALVRLIRAYSDQAEDVFTYDIEYMDKMGRIHSQRVKTYQLDRDFTKLRMGGHKFAIMTDTTWIHVNYEDFMLRLIEWYTRREKNGGDNCYNLDEHFDKVGE